MFHGENLAEQGATVPDAYWQTIAESIPHLVWVASSDGRIEYMNAEARDYTGWSHGASLENIGPAILHPDDAPGFYRAWHDAVRSATAYESEGRGRPIRAAPDTDRCRITALSHIAANAMS